MYMSQCTTVYLLKLKVDLLHGIVLKPTHSFRLFCIFIQMITHTHTLETGSVYTTLKDVLRDYPKKLYVNEKHLFEGIN